MLNVRSGLYNEPVAQEEIDDEQFILTSRCLVRCFYSNLKWKSTETEKRPEPQVISRPRTVNGKH
jgi:hypothetical protein